MFKGQPLEMIAETIGPSLGIGAVARGAGKVALKVAGKDVAKDIAEAAAKKATIAAGAGTGAALGVAEVKGSQYETTYNEAKAKGFSDERAKSIAETASEYSLKNAGQQALGAGLGLIGAATGPLDRLIMGTAANVGAKGVLKRTAAGALIEGGTEALQEGQGQYAGNVAAIDQGVLDPSQRFQGVAGSAALGAAIGGAMGGSAGAIDTSGAIQQAQRDAAISAQQDAQQAAIAEQQAQARSGIPAYIGTLDPAMKAGMRIAVSKGGDVAMPNSPAFDAAWGVYAQTTGTDVNDVAAKAAFQNDVISEVASEPVAGQSMVAQFSNQLAAKARNVNSKLKNADIVATLDGLQIDSDNESGTDNANAYKSALDTLAMLTSKSFTAANMGAQEIQTQAESALNTLTRIEEAFKNGAITAKPIQASSQPLSKANGSNGSASVIAPSPVGGATNAIPVGGTDGVGVPNQANTGTVDSGGNDSQAQVAQEVGALTPQEGQQLERQRVQSLLSGNERPQQRIGQANVIGALTPQEGIELERQRAGSTSSRVSIPLLGSATIQSDIQAIQDEYAARISAAEDAQIEAMIANDIAAQEAAAIELAKATQERSKRYKGTVSNAAYARDWQMKRKNVVSSLITGFAEGVNYSGVRLLQKVNKQLQVLGEPLLTKQEQSELFKKMELSRKELPLPNLPTDIVKVSDATASETAIQLESQVKGAEEKSQKQLSEKEYAELIKKKNKAKPLTTISFPKGNFTSMADIAIIAKQIDDAYTAQIEAMIDGDLNKEDYGPGFDVLVGASDAETNDDTLKSITEKSRQRLIDSIVSVEFYANDVSGKKLAKSVNKSLAVAGLDTLSDKEIERLNKVADVMSAFYAEAILESTPEPDPSSRETFDKLSSQIKEKNDRKTNGQGTVTGSKSESRGAGSSATSKTSSIIGGQSDAVSVADRGNQQATQEVTKPKVQNEKDQEAKATKEVLMEGLVSTTEPTNGELTSEDAVRLAELESELDAIESAERKLSGGKKLSLFTSLRGSLSKSDRLDISPDFHMIALQAKGGRGASLADIVANGSVDEFLPFEMRHDSPSFDGQASEEYIKDNIRNGNYLPFSVTVELQQLQGSKSEIQTEIDAIKDFNEANEKLAELARERAIERSESSAIDAEGSAAIDSKVAAEEVTNPTRQDVLDQQVRKENEAAINEREQIRRESEAGAGQFTLTQEDGRVDDTGSLFSKKQPTQNPSSPASIRTAIEGIFSGMKDAWARVSKSTVVVSAEEARKILDDADANNLTPAFSNVTRRGAEVRNLADNELVARDRFDFSKLEKVGSGSDRDVYSLGNGNVVKVAKTARGLLQNQYEGDYLLKGVLPEVSERGLNYVVVPQIENIKSSDLVDTFNEDGDVIGKVKASEMLAELGRFTQRDFDNKTDKLQIALEKYGFSDLQNYDVLWNDFTAKRNWGYKDGTAWHTDGGTIGGASMLEQYKGVKNLDDADFRTVYTVSKAIKKELGDADKATMYSKSDADTAQAFYMPSKVKGEQGKIYLIADRITKGKEASVWLHEVFHKRGEELLGKEAFTKLGDTVSSWKNKPEGSVERQIYEAANQRAKNSGNYDAEFLAYAIEEAIDRGVTPNMAMPATSARGWLARVKAAFSSALNKLLGTEMKPSSIEFSAIDLVSIAYGAAKLEYQFPDAKNMVSDGSVQFSLANSIGNAIGSTSNAAKRVAATTLSMKSPEGRKLAAQTANGVLDRFRGFASKVVALRELANYYAKEFTSDGVNLLDVVTDLNTKKGGEAINNLGRLDREILKDYRLVDLKERELVGEAMSLATQSQFDPSIAKSPTTPEQKAAKDAYSKLTPIGKGIYRKVLNEHRSQWDRYTKEVIQNLRDSGADAQSIAKIQGDLDAAKMDVYFAQQRFGEYVVSATDPKQKELAFFRRYESRAEAMRDMAKVQKENPTWTVTQPTKYEQRAKPKFNADTESFMASLRKRMEAQGRPESDIDAVDSAIRQVMETRLVKKTEQMLSKRKGIAGADTDMLRASFAGMKAFEQLIAATKYNSPISKALGAIDNHITKNSTSPDFDAFKAGQIAEAVKKSVYYKAEEGPGQTLVSYLNGFGFLSTMGYNVSSGLLNASSIPTLLMPQLLAKHGLKSIGAVTKAMKDISTNFTKDPSKLTGDVKTVIDYATEHGMLHYGEAKEILDVANGLGMGASRVVELGGRPMEWAEKFVNLTALLSSFRLNKAKGLSDAQALEEAKNDRYRSNFDNSSINKGALAKSPAGRVLMMLKGYGMAMTMTMMKDIKTILDKTQTKEERAYARKHILGMLGSHLILSGLTGMPFIALAPMYALAGLMADADDDRPYEEIIKDAVYQYLGKEGGNSMYYGLLGAGMASRVSMNDLIIKSRMEGADEKKAVEDYIKQIFGPAIGNVIRFSEKSVDLYRELQTLPADVALKRFSQNMPIPAAANLSKGLGLFEDDGIKYGTDGRPINDTPASNVEMLGQMLGFRPGTIAQAQNEKSAVQSVISKQDKRKKYLLQMHSVLGIEMLKGNVDPDVMDFFKEQVNEYNAKYPNDQIKDSSLEKRAKKLEARFGDDAMGFIKDDDVDMVESGAPWVFAK